ncbi:MAG: carboxypeptidase regulatory-like domain-containing protein [Terriglobia bacterium]
MKRACPIFIVVFLGTSLACLAQRASIVGTVTDTSGAVIPGVKVTVSNYAEGFIRRLVTNSVGAYVAADVPIGNYSITARVAGFRKLVHSGIVLRAGETLRVNMKMEVGEVTQEVNISGNVQRVQTETAEVSNVITSTQLENLNLNGRQFLSLTLLVPGVAPDNGLDMTNLQSGGDLLMSVNGGRRRFNNLTVNGTPDMGQGSYGTPTTFPALDSIAEVSIVTSNYGADTGKLGSAQIQVVTKSGTRQFHGDAFEYVRNDAFDANPFFQNRTLAPPGGNAPKSPLHWNDYGFTIGGPVYIPHHYNTDKSKTFFFWSEEWHKFNESQVINAPVPSLRQRQGDFSECDPNSGNFNSVVASGCALPVSPVDGNTYDTVQQMPGFNPQAFTNATALLNAFIPNPNSGPIGYIKSAASITDWREDTIRLDHHFSEKTSAYLSFSHDYDFTLAPTGASGSDTYDTTSDPGETPGDLMSFHVLHTFSPTMINDFMLGWQYNGPQTETTAVGPASISGSLTRPSNFVMNHIFAVNAGNPLLPDVSVSGGVPFSFVGGFGPFPRNKFEAVYVLGDDATRVVGSHTLKFGVYFERYHKDAEIQTSLSTQGALTFSPSASNSTGNALADMFLGNIQQYTESVVTKNGVPVPGYGRARWWTTDIEPYFQDNWKVTPKLSLNLGVRYYYYVPQHDISNPPADNNFLSSLYNPALQAQLDINDNLIPGSGFNYTGYGNGLVNCGRNGIPEGCTNVSKKNIGPRFGFAYDPFGTGKTVIRGGYGIYYDATSESGAIGLAGNPPSALAPTGFNISGYNNIVQGALSPFSSLFTVPPSETYPTVQQFSFGAQHMFPGDNLLSVSYVGSIGRHLTRIQNQNQVPVGVGVENAPALANTFAVNGLTNNPNPVQMCDASGNCNVQEMLANNVAPPDYFVPYRGYTQIGYNPLSANSNYNSLQVSFRHALGHGLSFQSAYTWSHALDDTSGDGISSNVDDSNLRRWYGNSRDNRSQMLVMNYVYNSPFFAHSTNAFARQVLGGWILSGITTFYTGTPISTYGVCGVTGFSSGVGENVQCNTDGPLKIKKSVFDDPQFGPTVTWYDPNVLIEPQASQFSANGEAGMFGYLGRNALTGPGRNDWDIALLKDFSAPWFNGEHSTLQFRLETFNTFNHTQWNGVSFACSGVPNNDGSSAFGRPCGGTVYNLGNGEVNSTWSPRVVQLALKFIF